MTQRPDNAIKVRTHIHLLISSSSDRARNGNDQRMIEIRFSVCSEKKEKEKNKHPHMKEVKKQRNSGYRTRSNQVGRWVGRRVVTKKKTRTPHQPKYSQ